MKKYIVIMVIAGVFFLLAACAGTNKAQTQVLEGRISTLEKDAYVPGLGVFMNTIQLHHAKLWFAGIDQNWPLARYEAGEMNETFENIQKYVKSRPEVTGDLSMIFWAIDSVRNAIAAKSPSRFKSEYILLTNTCNSRHRMNDHAFNVITIPSMPPVTDQKF
jgi:hypothetical protein